MKPYKILVSGSRDFDDYDLLANQLRRIIRKEERWPEKIIHGGAPGADSLASKFAYEEKINLDIVGAQWGDYGNDAGSVRNNEMICHHGMERNDWVVAFPLPHSRGTRNMISLAKKLNCFNLVVVEDGELVDV